MYLYMYRGGNKRYLYCQLKPQVNANRAGGSGGWGLQKFLGCKMPLDWLKIGLNLGKKLCYYL